MGWDEKEFSGAEGKWAYSWWEGRGEERLGMEPPRA